MIELDLHTLRENPTWLAVLFAYQAAIEELAATEAEAAAASRSAKRGSSQEGSTSPDESAAGAGPDDDTDDDTESDALDDAPSQDADSEDAATHADDSGTKRRRGSRWVTRQTIEGVESAELSKIHGRLIAYGFLKCDLTDRSAGVVYQLTAEAKQVLAQVDAGDCVAEEDEALIDVA